MTELQVPSAAKSQPGRIARFLDSDLWWSFKSSKSAVGAAITLGLVIEGAIDSFAVPLWVIAISAGMIALGTATGGWRLIKTLGGRIYKIRPVDGFVSQIAGAGVILGAAMFGGPVSTTQVMSSAIMGAGAAQRVSKVRWQVGYEMLVAWVLTIPLSALLAVLFYFPMNWLLT